MIINNTSIEVIRGSLIDQDVDVIVNAANTQLRGGGGIDGAIHAAAGRVLSQYLYVNFPNGTDTGVPVITPGFNLPQRIIHVPGPIWKGTKQNYMELAASYTNSLMLANINDAKSVAFCSISTGIYGCPIEIGAEIAITEACQYALDEKCTLEKIVFAMFKETEFQIFSRKLEDYLA